MGWRGWGSAVERGLDWLKHNTFTDKIPRQKFHSYLNNEQQESKTGHTKGRANEESQEGEYGWCTFYTGMDMEYSSLLKSPWEED
jgi:hypothetical protein